MCPASATRHQQTVATHAKEGLVNRFGQLLRLKLHPDLKSMREAQHNQKKNQQRGVFSSLTGRHACSTCAFLLISDVLELKEPISGIGYKS